MRPNRSFGNTSRSPAVLEDSCIISSYFNFWPVRSFVTVKHILHPFIARGELDAEATLLFFEEGK